MLAYLFSRYPVVSQTFCDSEMMALEGLGVPVAVGSINPPPDSFRHPRLAGRKAPVFYPPPSRALAAMRRAAEEDGRWAPLAELIADHDSRYGEAFKAATRARNALYFAGVFGKIGVRHVHVHFANRATHTALFLKRLGFSFSFTAHAQDFMVDLGSDELLAEMAREAAFVAGVSDFSSGLLREKCPDSAEKIVRVYNGLDPDAFPQAKPAAESFVLRIVSVGRLIEFKGFKHLIAACAELEKRGVKNELTIVGDGPLEEELRRRAGSAKVTFAGVRSGEEVKALLSESHVFALASIVDSKGASDILPTVIAEAMAAGLPVVSTRLVGIPEMVEHDKTGLLCEPGDEQEMADAIERLARDPGLRERCGAAGRELARERFSLEVTARQLLELLPEIDAQVLPYADLAYLAPAWGARDPRSCDAELAAAAAHPRMMPVALELHGDFRSHSDPPPPGLQFAPDPVVVEAACLASPERVERAASLTADERLARLAVYFAEFFERTRTRFVHAARSQEAELAWLIAQLLDIKATCCIEEGGENPRGVKELKGIDLSIRRTRRRIGPFRFRIRPRPVTPKQARAFIDSLLT